MRRICVVVGSRANYSSIKSVMSAIADSKNLELLVVVTASAVINRYGSVADLIEGDGFNINAKIYMLIEGETPATMAKSTGVGLIELPTVFETLQPDVVLTVGDRFETMATTLAAAYMNIPVAHTMGGEVSGTIDESIRHAITKFAHVHFPASQGAADRIRKLGERVEDIVLVGCPRIDLIKQVLEGPSKLSSETIFGSGVGNPFSLTESFVVVSQHPVTTEYGEGEFQITETLNAIKQLGLPALVLWPNADAGSEDISRGIRKWRENNPKVKNYFCKNLATEIYIKLMQRTSCLIGNSSSGIRDCAFIGTPVVNVGSRQDMRERGANVLDVGYDQAEIAQGLSQQLEHGHYKSEAIYGDGAAGIRIAKHLENCDFKIQKTITY